MLMKRLASLLIFTSSKWTTNATGILSKALFASTKFENNSDSCFETVSEEIKFSGWRKIVRRKVKFPNGKNIEFDVVSQGCPSIIVFTWDRKTATTTLIREFHPGVEKIMYGVVAGMYENKKHDSPLQCAQYELEEEAQLSSSNWIPLLDDCETSVPFDKYSDNRFYPFLALDCEAVSDPRPMDAEEYIELERNVTVERLLELIGKGSLNINSSYTVLLALRKLEELGFVTRKVS